MIEAEKLPVYQHREKIIEAIKNNRVIVVESPTGSGKTTQLPRIIYDYGFAEHKKIAITQPRRIAAVSVAHYIARLYSSEIPGLVGYKMRFVDETVPESQIIVMTDGILLQELKSDPDLSEYGLIMVDEAHERSLNIDFILGLLKDILKRRDDLKVIVSSATINPGVFSEYFDGCPIISIDARMYPVELVYEPPEHYEEFQYRLIKIKEIVRRIIKSGKRGDILIFLSGEAQIKECVETLEELNKKRNLVILPLYSRLSQEEQERVFNDYPGKRKIIVATNIAETSVTIDGVVYVIDSGYAKMNYYNPKNFTSMLVEVPISKASCNQRKGRAGRTAPGVCYRLYTEEDYEKRQLFTTEEIYRTDLSEVILRMAELGIKEFENFDYISHPGVNNIRSAVQVLQLLEAIDGNRDLTEIGRLMTKFPIIPQLSRMIVASIMEYPDVLEEVLIAAAFLNGKPPFVLPHGEEFEARKAHHSFRHKLGDFVSYIKIFKAYEKAKDKAWFCNRYYLDTKAMEEIYNVKNQLAEIVSEIGIPVTGGGDYYNYLYCLARGLIQFVCKRDGRSTYRSLTAYGIKIHPGSVMYRQKPEYIVAGEILKTSQMYAMSVSPLNNVILKRLSPELLKSFTGKSAKKVEKLVKARDYTNFIKLGGEKLEIKKIGKKKKCVLIPYEKLGAIASRVDKYTLSGLKGLRGSILLNGYELLSGVNLRRIFEIAPKIAVLDDVLDEWPKSQQFEYMSESYDITRFIPHLMKPCRKSKTSKKLGFLTLLTNGEGFYWFSSYKDFTLALEESISSLEALIDEEINVLDEKQEEIVNETYRRLLNMIESD